MFKINRQQGGFSLLEIMVVVVIIGILVASIAPTLFGETEKARLTRVKVDITALAHTDYIGTTEIKEQRTEAAAVNTVAKLISEVEQVVSISSGEWDYISIYYARSFYPDHANVSLPKKCAQWINGGSMPTDKQLKLALKIRKNAYSDGFDYIS